MRISFVGDVMCEPMLMKAARAKEGSYDFSNVFHRVASLFERSDYVVANLETPIAGRERGLSRSLFSFNAPEEFLDSLKAAGITCVTTANNHSFDRGIEGALQTICALDRAAIDQVGMVEADRQLDPLRKEIDGVSVAFLSYTYGVNCLPNECDIADQTQVKINLLRPQADRQNPAGNTGRRSFLKRILLRLTTKEQRIAIKKKLGMKYYSAYKDDVFDETTAAPYLEQLTADIVAAKQHADMVVCCLHMGGQFNAEPGRFSEYVAEQALQAGCDAIIASHPHVVQKALIEEGRPVFFSLGNFSMSPNSVYILPEHLPEYGLIAHLDILEDKIDSVSFSIIKIIEQDGRMTVWPVDELFDALENEQDKVLLEKDVQKIYCRVTGSGLNDTIIRREYPLQH